MGRLQTMTRSEKHLPNGQLMPPLSADSVSNQCPSTLNSLPMGQPLFESSFVSPLPGLASLHAFILGL